MLKHGTVCFLKKDDKYLLVLIEYGDSNRRWNGIGGMVNEHETFDDALIREIQEEVGVTIKIDHLKKMAVIQENPDFHLHIYICDAWEGELHIVDETIKQLQWFVPATIPYDAMWPDNKYWLPEVLEGRKIKATLFKNVYTDIKPLTENDIEIQEVAELN